MVTPVLVAALVATPAVSFDSNWQEIVQGTAFEGLTGDVRVGFGEEDGELALQLDGASASYRGVHLGALSVRLTQPRGGRTHGKATLTGPLADKAEADFEVDLEVGPFLEGLRWGRTRLEAAVVVRGLDLGRLTERLPVLAATGKADLTVTVGGAVAAPYLHAHFAGEELTWRGERVGALTLRWDHSGGGSEVTARWGASDGPGLDAEAEFPVRLHLGTGAVVFEPEGEHSLSVTVRRLTETELRPLWVAPPGVHVTL